MPRDSNGAYTLPPGINPVIPGTDIDVDWANPTLQDIANALSDSLSRTGSGGMLAPFRFADGTLAAPGISWNNQPQAGWYRAANNDFRYAINGADILQLRPIADGGSVINTPLALNGALTVTGAVNVTGNITASGTIDAAALTLGGVAVATINDAITYAVALG